MIERTKKADTDLNRLAEYSDARREEQYIQQKLSESYLNIRYILLIWGVLFLIAGLLRMNISPTGAWVWDISARGLFFWVSLLLFFYFGKPRSARTMMVTSCFFPLLSIGVYAATLGLESTQSFLEQALPVVVLLLVASMLPSRWIYLVATDVAIVMVFMGSILLRARDTQWPELLEVGFYLLVTLCVVAYSQHCINCNQRIQHGEEEQLENMLCSDALTGIYNRMWFDDTLEKWCGSKRGMNEDFSLVLFDIDNFKAVNDTFGHLVGDKVLVETVALVQRHMRGSDLFARWGGEEFVILLPHVPEQKAYEFSERIRKIIADHSFDEVGSITCSFGVVKRQADETAQNLVRRVDDQLYSAKKRGKNCVVCVELQPA